MALGIGLAGSGLLVFYYLGIMSVFQEQGNLLLLLILMFDCCSAAEELQLLASKPLCHRLAVLSAA